MAELIEDASFDDEDWYGEELADRAYTRCTFSQVDLTEAQTQGVVFTDCAFVDVRFNTSRHASSAFVGCTFERCNLFDAEFVGCKLTGSTFHKSALRPLRVIGGDWSFVGLSGADLRDATVEGTRMREIDLTGANCEDAAFTNVDLSGAQLRGATFRRCDLRGSDLSAFEPGEVGLAGAIIDAAQAVVLAQALGVQVR
ncbi:pentapeptide repeat-containing protein [Planosporangium thailandense]|uniref:pentapeptide repeat-containing protein n=1 Tax=Planosporangium thailandense TaxID=765197 RepID=UPI003B8339C9